MRPKPTHLRLLPPSRPEFGAQPSTFPVPPQHTAPVLTLVAQVLPTPEAQREAAQLAGQTSLFDAADQEEEPR